MIGKIDRRPSWQARGNSRKFGGIVGILGHPLNENLRHITEIFIDNARWEWVAKRYVDKRL